MKPTKPMGKNLTPRRKAAIVTEAAKYRCPLSGKLPKGALNQICLKFNEVSERFVQSYCASAKKQEEAGILSISFDSKKKGNVGRPSKLTDEVKDIYRAIIAEFAHRWSRLTHRMLLQKLEDQDCHFVLSTVQEHLKKLKAYHKVVKLKPLLTDTHKENRCRFVMDQIDVKHVGCRHTRKFRDL